MTKNSLLVFSFQIVYKLCMIFVLAVRSYDTNKIEPNGEWRA